MKIIKVTETSLDVNCYKIFIKIILIVLNLYLNEIQMLILNKLVIIWQLLNTLDKTID